MSRATTHVSADFDVQLAAGLGLHEQGEQLMTVLVDMQAHTPDLLDCGTSSNVAESRLTLFGTIDTSDEAYALQRALHIFRTAIHTIGGATPGWPGDEDARRAVSQFRKHAMQLELDPA